ncbi:MAG: MATE family efflux transporter [Ruminococcaceae bacterium]|nr:MATE family efflux transporter [Oscillospiraceae bacterium]
MVREMTHGKPLSLILGFCLPMLLGNLFQQLYSMVDTIIVGKFIDVDALAGVGSTGSVSFLIIGFTMGITSGSCVLPSQCFGAGDHSEMRKYIANAIYLCIITTVIVTALAVTMCYPLLKLMQTPADIIDIAYDYIIVVLGGICVTMAYNLMAGILRAMGDSRTPLYFLILASVINIGLDLLFIIVCNMGVAGAGWATVISQGISAALCFIYMRRSYPMLRFEKSELKFDGRRVFALAKIGVPVGLQSSITAVGSIILQSAVNSLGKVAVAAVTAAGKIQNMVVAPMDTLGITMATYAGQNLGAGNVGRIGKGMKCAFASGFIYSAAALLAIWLFGTPLCLMFVEAEETEVIEKAVYFLWVNACFYPVLSVLFIVRSSLQGLGYSALTMLAGACELISRVVIAVGFVETMGFDAVCFASPVAWVSAVALLVGVYFIKMKSLGKKTDENGILKEGVINHG